MERTPLIDAHCHLDFAGNAVELAAAYAACGGALSGTCDPRDFDRVCAMLAPYAPRVRVGLGLHPWWVADGTCGEGEVALFERLAPAASLISEVGLDFQPRRADTRDAQIEAFERVCVAAARPSAEFPRRIMSIPVSYTHLRTVHWTVRLVRNSLCGRHRSHLPSSGLRQYNPQRSKRCRNAP